ncbi:MAG: hypothetical protein KC591_02075 [Gemmatimonadetes bacterium]|nr:hypothetical protein [Gemmatimonadota bacterium]
MTSPTFSIAAAFVVLGVAGYATLEAPTAAYPRLMAYVALASVGWLLARHAARSRPERAAPLGLILGLALAARLLVVVPYEPLSDDLYRYLWDGRVANAGIDPFAHPPTSPELADLRDDEIWPRVNHPDVPTIYPAVAQLAFRLLDAAGGDPRSPRVLAAFADFATVVLLVGLLRRRGRPGGLAVVAAWCPLAILETGGGGHVDALGVFLLVASLALEGGTRARALAAGILLGASILVKPVAVFLLPALALARPRGERLPWVIGGLIALALVFLHADAGAKMFTGFRTYAENWRFHDLVYGPLVRLGLGPRGARLVLAAALGIASIVVPLRVRDPLAAGGIVVAMLLALSPTVHPWYALWLVPFVPFLPRALELGATTFLLFLPVVYASAWTLLRTGEWTEPLWSRVLGWAPALLVTAWAAWRQASASRRAGSG